MKRSVLHGKPLEEAMCAVHRLWLLVFAVSFSPLYAGDSDRLQFISTSGGSWDAANGWTNITDHAIGGIGAGMTGDWVDGSWAYIRGNINNVGNVSAVAAYGINWAVGERVVTLQNGATLGLGAGGIVMERGGPLRFFGSYTVRLTADQRWTCNGTADALRIKIDPRTNANVSDMQLVADEGVTLTLTDALTLEVGDETVFGGNVVVERNACLNLGAIGLFGANRVTLKGPSATLAFSGATGDVAREFALADGGVFSPAGHVWSSSRLLATGDATATNVVSGRLVVTGDVFSVEVAAGAVLRIAGAIVDADGFPAAIINSGPGALINDTTIIGDEPVMENPLIVGPDRTVHVYGDGMGPDTTVILAGGVFKVCRDATIRSPLVLAANSSISVDECVEALFTGGIDATDAGGASSCSLSLDGNGRKVFSGDAAFAASNGFRLVAGTALVTNCTWTVGPMATVGLYQDAERLIVRDGGDLVLEECTSETIRTLEISVTGAAAAGVLEIGADGALHMHANCLLTVGKSAGSHGTFRLNGGLYRDDLASSPISLGWESTATGTLELRSGVFDIMSSIRSGAGATNRIVWHGGTMKFRSDGTYGGVLFRRRTNTTDGPSSITMEIQGSDCLLDIGCERSAVITGQLNAAASPYPWFSAAAGLLTITNSLPGGNERAFLVSQTFTNMNVRLAPDVKLRFAETTPEFSFGFYELAPGVATNAVEHAPAVVVTAETVRVASGAVFALHGYADWWFRNLTFEDDSILSFGIHQGCVDGLSIPGTLSLPSRLRMLALSNIAVSGTGNALVRAGEGVSGNPEFVSEPGSRKYEYGVGAELLSVFPYGFSVMIR